MDYFYYGSYILVAIGALICLIASLNVKATYNKYNKVRSSSGRTAEAVAQEILNSAGIYDVSIERISGSLTDHYSPNEKVLRLSDSVYGSTSVAAIGVAAHECGHAIQHKEEYGPLRLRSAAVPIANIGSKIYWPFIIAGLALGMMGLAEVGVVLFLFVVFFQLITLPVEFDASKRALGVLDTRGILAGVEYDGAKKVLTAAALTYVASLLSSILQLLRLIALTRGSGGSSRRRYR
ncbi:MAG: zinc metallopeptidase [Lachnospiraceae bacterium]|nr:zinc metallopeptidase [Lachnospiraceae bacterium]